MQDFSFRKPYYSIDVHEGAKYVVASPEAAEELKTKSPRLWRELYRTPKNHQYPAVMLKREKKK